LIPLYAIGVFTSFTLSQGGMARRHLRLREEGWRLGLLINGVGAITTAVVTLVIAFTKFHDGAWAVIVFVPVTVWLLVRMNHRYAREAAELERDLATFDRSTPPRPSIVVLVDSIDRETLHALQYAKTLHPGAIEALHVEEDARDTRQLLERWHALDTGIELRVVPGGRDRVDAIAGYVAAMPSDRDVNVIVPAPAHRDRFERLRAYRAGTRLTRALWPFEQARITVVRDHEGHGDAEATLLPRPSHLVYVLVDRIDRASLRALRYARSLGATEIRAVHAGVDPDAVGPLKEAWLELGVPVDLDVIECWDRNIPRALEHYIVGDADPRAEVTVVLPRRDFALLRQRILHDRTSRAIARALGRYPHVDLAIVPFYFGRHPAPEPPDPSSQVEGLVPAGKQ
jgi:hypothetical protein